MSPTLLDNELERHEGPEPRVLTQDVRAILARVIRPGEDDGGESVTLIAEKARVSTRTVYRVLQRPKDTTPDYDGVEVDEEGKPVSIGLDLADRLCLAAEGHLAMCRLAWPDGPVTDYF